MPSIKGQSMKNLYARLGIMEMSRGPTLTSRKGCGIFVGSARLNGFESVKAMSSAKANNLNTFKPVEGGVTFLG